MNKEKFTNASFKVYKARAEKISMVTAYDYTSAALADAAEIDTLLVGDSLAMVMLGYQDTLKVTIDDIIRHGQAVRRGAPQAFIVADMPYLSYHISVQDSVKNAGRLIVEGTANAVKLEGGAQFLEDIKAIIRAQIPVIGHLGLTPQSVNQLGGYKVQAKRAEAATKLFEDAKALENVGVSAIVLECIPPDIAKNVTEQLQIPTIGIGAGVDCDGQVLVFHDMLGMFNDFTPKFVKQYADVGQVIKSALHHYHQEVKNGQFPDEAHSFRTSDLAIDDLY